MTDILTDKISRLYSGFGVTREASDLAVRVMSDINDRFMEIDRIREINQLKVVSSFHEVGLSESHFAGTTGYGYDDVGREKLENAFAQIFSAESALLRWQISSGDRKSVV